MSRSIEETYQKKTPIEHILLRPDTYVGSIEQETCYRYIISDNQLNFKLEEVRYVPALYKIFDEVLVNAADNYQRDHRMDTLRVELNKKEGCIKVHNNGKGIPVVIHQEFKIYVPHLIFGQLLTGSNYNDNDKKIVGGRNGYGAKLANIFSNRFILSCGDQANRKEFNMEWRDNMNTHSEPEIKSYSSKDYTSVTFYPDFKRFGMKHLEDDIYKVMEKRVYDIAGIFPSVNVILNGKEIKLKSFKEYVGMYLWSGDQPKKARYSDLQSDNERWEVIVSIAEGDPKHVSFVNAICTSKGGTHVNYLLDQLVESIQEHLQKKHKDLVVKPHQIKSKLWIFVNCLIENPTFDSQTKETLTTKVSQFGSTYKFSEKCIKDILKSGIIDDIVNEAKAKELSKMAKSTAGGKKVRLSGVPKLEDANEAGTRNSEKCTLILTEGDSAKGLAMAGIEVVGRDYYGVFPLKGKLLNVREAANKQVSNNDEIQNIVKIMGLQFGKVYDSLKSLRYGSIMIMSDQDTDGSHIKGLVINFIHTFWPTLFKMRGFLKEFITPLLKVSKGEQRIPFFTMQDFKTWSSRTENVKSWRIKYYKGLGTSDNKQAKEYFNAISRHRLEFVYTDEKDDDAIDLVFNKKKADERKTWLETYDPENIVVYDTQLLKYVDFVNKEYIHFSYADNHRSIGSVVDGLKPGQRKILYGCFKRNLTQQIKVAQLAGYVAEHSAYHHGEMSLTETIINMAQNFVGSNNINLLMPNGQFGSRHQGGKDHASARYVFTCMSRLTRKIFPESDDHSLTYVEDDGQMVEPTYYVPILPMVLVNGNKGIGTGWSTHIPNYDPRELCRIMMDMINDKPAPENLLPWYKGYLGDIVMKPNGKSVETRGVIEATDDPTMIHVTDLPVGRWTKDYKEQLDKFIDEDRTVVTIKEHHTDNKIHFEIQLDEDFQRNNENNLHSALKLSNSIHLGNLVAFNRNNIIRRYENVRQILQEFYQLRIDFYGKRKEYLRSKLKRDLQILDMKVKFVLELLEDKLVIKNVKRADLCARLEKGGYVKFSDLTKIQSTKLQEKVGTVKIDEKPEENAEEAVNDEREQVVIAKAKEYDYLLTMNMWTLTYQRVEELKKQHKAKSNELRELEATCEKDMWREDIKEFLSELDIVEKIELEEQLKADKGKGSKDKTKKPRRKMIKKTISSDSEAEEKSKKKKPPKRGEDESSDSSAKKSNDSKNKKSRSKKAKSEESTEDVKAMKNSRKMEEAIPQQAEVQESMKGDLYSRVASNLRQKGIADQKTLDNLFKKSKKNNIFPDTSEASSQEDMIFLLDKYPINKDSTFRSSDDEDAEFIVRRVERNKKKKKYDSEDSD